RVLVVHQKPRTNLPATQVAQGWVFTNGVSTLSPWGGSALASVLDDPGRAYADPEDVVLRPDQRRAFVACAGADTVLALGPDTRGSAADGWAWADGWWTLSKAALPRSRRYVAARIPTQANPRRLALSGDGKTLVVSNHLADSLTVIDAGRLTVVRHVAL